MTRRTGGPTRKDRQRVQERIAELLRREPWGELIAMCDRLERRLVCVSPVVDRAAIAAEVDEALEAEEFDLDGCRAVQGWYVGDGQESIRVVVEMENPQTEQLHRLVEKAVVGRIGIARALAIEVAALAAGFSGRYADLEEA